MPELTMPRLSDTMQEGTLARWLKKQGDPVERGEIVAEIETDKATMELEAYESGVLEQILVQEGQTVPIGQPIAVVGAGGGSEGARERGSGGAGQAVEEAVPGGQGQPGQEVRRSSEMPIGASPDTAAGDSRETVAEQGTPSDDQVKASPMARAIARERGIDLHAIRGSGPGGRVIRSDVEAAAGASSDVGHRTSGAAPAASDVRRSTSGVPASDDEEIPLTAMRRVVAKRMVESVQSAPHFYLTMVIDAEELVRFRAEINERLGKGGDSIKISLNDMLVKACGVALRASPDANVSFGGDKILRHRRVNIGIAVAIDNGLIVPVVRDADQKSLGQLSHEARALIEKAHAGKLTPDDYSGGTFTISNLGMFGIDHFTAIINPPESAILAVGATQPEVVARDGQPVVRQTMKLTLSIDHRVLDGATAARFLQQLKAILEEPLRIVV